MLTKIAYLSAARAESSSASTHACLGEFTPCRKTRECVMDESFCGTCKPGQYLCPSDQKTCVDSAADYVKCPKMKGTHLDWTLPIEQRLDFLVAHTSLDTQIQQLMNGPPPINELGIPAYQWLNDDQHGIGRTTARATVFPNGCAMGAGWNKDTAYNVGRILGIEARGLHNGFLHNTSYGEDAQYRQMDCNGCGITLYAPNLNLARDPRWGRAQVSVRFSTAFDFA